MATKLSKSELLEKSREIISQLKEMEHYSEANIEKLSEFWFLIDEKLHQKDNAERINQLLICQNTFQDMITAFIEDYQIECNRIENED